VSAEPSSFGIGEVGVGEIAIDQASGDVYTLAEDTPKDVETNLVQKFNKEGVPIAFEDGTAGNYFKTEGQYQIAVDNTCYDRSLESSACKSFDPSNGDLYIAGLGSAIDKYAPSGEADGKLSPPGGFTEVTAVALGPNGEVFAGEYNSGNIYEFSPEGIVMNSGNPVLTGLSSHLIHPNDLAVNSKGDLYVAENSGERGTAEFAPEPGGGFNSTQVGKELPGGTYGDISVAVDEKTNDVFVDNYNSISEYNEKGEPIAGSFGSFTGSFGVAINEETGTVYATEYARNAVDMFVQENEEAPRVLTEPPEYVEETSALMVGRIDSQNEETRYEYEWWGKNESEAQKIVIKEAFEPGYGFNEVDEELTGLTPSTIYHYRIIAKNVLGTTVGVVRTFETAGPKAPDAHTGTVSEVRDTSARLHGEVNPQKLPTTYEFLIWSQIEADAQKVPVTSVSAGSGTVSVAVSQVAEDLASSAIYHYRLVAKNAKGTSEGTEETFETIPTPPVATTLSASATTINSATLNGTVDPSGATTSYTFEYGYTSSYGQSLPLTNAGAGQTVEAVSMLAEELKPNTIYHYRLVATNNGGASYGEDREFTTAANPAPIAVTLPASEVAQNTATLNGTVDPNSQRTQYEFQIGTSTEYGVNLFADAGSGEETESVTIAIDSLQPGTTYHYRLVAISEGGTSYGADQTFTTGIFPTSVLTAPPTAPLLATPPIAFPTVTTGTTTKTTTKKTKGKKKAKPKRKAKAKKSERVRRSERARGQS
jgi:hypothetical protein